MGGRNKSSYKTTNTVLTFDEHSRWWVQSYPALRTALTNPAVIGYHDHLIVAGGQNSNHNRTPDVSILDTNRKWKTGQPLPIMDDYRSVLIQDILYLVGQNTKTVLQAHVPTLISGAKSDVWETLPNTPYNHSSPITIDNTLLTVGGSDKPLGVTTSIQMYDPTTNQWTRVGDLPEPITKPRVTELNSELFVLGSFSSSHVYTSKLALVY